MDRVELLPRDNVVDIDLGSDAFRQNWFEICADWAERPPLYHYEANLRGVICARHADVREVYSDPDRFSIKLNNPAFKRFDPFMGINRLSAVDGPEHTRLRRIILPPFSPASIRRIEERCQVAIDELLDELEKRGPGAAVDVRNEYAAPIMERVLLDEMFHFNPEQKAAFARMNHSRAALASMKPEEEISPKFVADFEFAKQTLMDILLERSAKPGDDFISSLFLAEYNGDRLAPDEVLGTLFGISSATTGTTPSSIAFALMLLSRHPEQMALLRAQPELAPIAMEEALRHHGPGYFSFPRFATRDTEVGGTPIEKGMMIHQLIAAANLDPTVYADPLRFDITRDPAGIMTFGGGAHVCIAARMARGAMRRGVMSIIERFPNLRLADPAFKPFYVGSIGELVPTSMPMLI